MHRRNPILHLVELELATYDRDYAPAAERAAAWAEHLAAWPRVVNSANESLGQVSAPVAEALLGPARGLAAGISAEPDTSTDGAGRIGGFGGAAHEAVRDAALAAHARLIAYLERIAADGDPDPALGGPALSALMSSAEALPVDVGRLAEQADALEILELRERARREWGTGFTLQRFHKALLDLGSPALGLLGAAVERGKLPAGTPGSYPW